MSENSLRFENISFHLFVAGFFLIIFIKIQDIKGDESFVMQCDRGVKSKLSDYRFNFFFFLETFKAMYT